MPLCNFIVMPVHAINKVVLIIGLSFAFVNLPRNPEGVVSF